METIQHKTLKVNGINMHVAEKGPLNGPVVLFIHGFPELWYSWRHQILALSSLGYRAVAPDLRGYGDTDSPSEPQKYTCLHMVGDLIGLIDALEPQPEKIFVVGHDWGALIAWYICLFRPDRVKALVNLSVPFFPRNPETKFVDIFRAAYGDDVYICRFQEYGDMEAVLAKLGTERVMKEFFGYRSPGPFMFPKGKEFDRPEGTSLELPSWLSEEDFHYYTSKLDKTGFTGGINYYRNLDKNWELTAAWTGAQVKVPTKFIIADEDLVYYYLNFRDYIENGGMKKDVPLLEEVVVIKGAAHFFNQEKPHETNKHISDFFKQYTGL